MQAQCPQCATRVQIDDAKVPDKPFKVRCPKCQAVMTLPGRGAGPVAPEAPAAEPASPPPDMPDPTTLAHRERLAANANDALIALAGPAASPVAQALTRLGFTVDTVDDVEEGARLLEQGAYEVAVTSRTVVEPGRPEPLSQRMLRLPLDARRRVFVILVGDEFRTADGTQAWAAQADLVLNPKDVSRCEPYIRSTLAERRRLYQPLEDARRRIETT